MDIKKATIEDLQKEIATAREDLRSFRFGEAGARSRDVRAGRNLRRDIARMLTEIRVRSLASERKSA